MYNNNINGSYFTVILRIKNVLSDYTHSSYFNIFFNSNILEQSRFGNMGVGVDMCRYKSGDNEIVYCKLLCYDARMYHSTKRILLVTLLRIFLVRWPSTINNFHFHFTYRNVIRQITQPQRFSCYKYCDKRVWPASATS